MLKHSPTFDSPEPQLGCLSIRNRASPHLCFEGCFRSTSSQRLSIAIASARAMPKMELEHLVLDTPMEAFPHRGELLANHLSRLTFDRQPSVPTSLNSLDLFSNGKCARCPSTRSEIGLEKDIRPLVRCSIAATRASVRQVAWRDVVQAHHRA